MIPLNEFPIDVIIKNIGDYTDDAILITEAEPVDMPGPRILWCNPAFTRMTGYSLAEIEGLTPRILQGDDTDKKELARLRAALKSWSKVRVELKNYRKDGTAFWVDLGIQPVADSKGFFRYWVAVQRDTTERRVRQHLLDRTTQIIDHAPLALALLSAEKRVTYTNDCFDDLVFGENPAAALPMAYDKWLRTGLAGLAARSNADFDHDAWIKNHWDAIFGPEMRVEQQLAGEWYEFRRIDTPDGDQLVVGENIESRIALQEQIHQMTKLDAMGQLTSGVAHDFNNILAIVLGNIELLKLEDTTKTDKEQFIKEAINAVLRGRSLTESLLSFARKSRMTREKVSIACLLQETFDMFERTSGTAIVVEAKIAPDLPNLFVDAGLLQSAVLNLLVNGRDAMPSGGSITVLAELESPPFIEGSTHTGETDGPFVKITVKDHGRGMSARVRSRAIEPFYSTKQTGSGLGLSMVHGFAAQSGGKLSIISAQGHGTEVRLHLPVAKDEMAQPEGISDNEPTLTGYNILLVEDEPAVRRLLKRTLESAGAIVTVADSGDSAVAIVLQWPDFDMLVTDVVMPGLVQGDALALKFQAITAGKPTLLLSGNPEMSDPDNATGALDACILMKPVERDTLISKVSDLAAAKRS